MKYASAVQLQVFAGYRSAVDNPTSGFYKEIMEQYPNVKVCWPSIRFRKPTHF